MPARTTLMIDDDPDDIEFVKDTINEIDASMRFMSVQDCETALKLIKSVIPDFIMLDLNLPGMTGKQCLIELKKMPTLKKTTIIIYTTSTNPKDKNEAKQLGATHFLNKANTMKELRAALQILLIDETSEIV